MKFLVYLLASPLVLLSVALPIFLCTVIVQLLQNKMKPNAAMEKGVRMCAIFSALLLVLELISGTVHWVTLLKYLIPALLWGILYAVLRNKLKKDQ